MADLGKIAREFEPPRPASFIEAMRRGLVGAMIGTLVVRSLCSAWVPVGAIVLLGAGCYQLPGLVLSEAGLGKKTRGWEIIHAVLT